MTLCAMDFETTGLFPASANHIVEYAIVMYDTKLKSITTQISQLVAPNADDEDWQLPFRYGVPISPGLSKELILKHGCTPAVALATIDSCISRSDVLVAHNADFEQKYLQELYRQHGLASEDIERDYPVPKLWVDTMRDCGLPSKQNLASFCNWYGAVEVPNHRAMPDTLAMLQGLINYGCEDAIENAKKRTEG